MSGQAVVLPTGGMTRFQSARSVPVTGADVVVASPDLTGDGKADLLVRATGGTSHVYPGAGAGGFGAPIRQTSAPSWSGTWRALHGFRSPFRRKAQRS